MVLRDTPKEAQAVWAAALAHNRAADKGKAALFGSADLIADRLKPYLELGFTTIIARFPTPHDRQTIDRLGEVRSALGS